MLGVVKGLGERALHLAGLPLRWAGAQLAYGRMQVEAEALSRTRTDGDWMRQLHEDLAGLHGGQVTRSSETDEELLRAAVDHIERERRLARINQEAERIVAGKVSRIDGPPRS